MEPPPNEGGDPRYDVVSCGNSADALECLAAEEFDVVLCDLMSPGLSGMQLYHRAVERRGDLARRFVFITGGALTPDVAAFANRWDVGVLGKPVGFDILQSAIESVHQAAGAR